MKLPVLVIDEAVSPATLPVAYVLVTPRDCLVCCLPGEPCKEHGSREAQRIYLRDRWPVEHCKVEDYEGI